MHPHRRMTTHSAPKTKSSRAHRTRLAAVESQIEEHGQDTSTGSQCFWDRRAVMGPDILSVKRVPPTLHSPAPATPAFAHIFPKMISYYLY